ncbi:MAG TPA: citrate synthase/methylcitrate synthase [Thermoanaerobaculia bacterium]|nr:citrate synthase/methylcitrate synthase [Thermoanaerobaculia bacterium]
MTTDVKTVNNGLEGVVAAETHLSMVDGERGELVIGGFRVEELASWSFEDTVELLWAATGHHGRPHSTPLPAHTETLLRDAAKQHVPAMDALRMAAGTLRADDDGAAAQLLVGTFPTIVAAYWRLLHGREPIAPRKELGIAANYLYMLNGVEPHAELVRGMETYLNTVVDHGLNASTFTARVIASTGSDFVSAITGAVGALKGPLHGGAPGPALDMVFEIGDASRAEEVLRRKIANGERLMGFGHRVYKVRDPRADVLAAAAERMFTRAGDMHLYDLARSVEQTALRLLEEHKPGRKLQTNVEFYTALLLHGLGLDVPLFTPTFAISRVAGWTAHCFEQRSVGRLIRPQSVYVGAMP